MSNTTSPVARKRVDWAALGWLLLFFWYFSGVTQALILFSGTTGFAGFRDAATSTSSPTLTTPDATVPEKPRKSRLARFTHCTGIRNG